MARVEEERLSAVDLGDVNDNVSASDFSDYMAADLHRSENRYNNFNVFWNKEGLVGPQALLSTCSQSGLMVKEKIKIALERFDFSRFEYILAQFWAPVLLEGRYILTTSDQPFGMSYLKKGLCRYRKICANYNYGAGGESRGNILPTGPPSRVFLNGLPEYSPNMQFYSTEECPLRDVADCCKIRHYLALPVFEEHSKYCAGVLELVARSESLEDLLSLIRQISAELKGAQLRTFNISTELLRDSEVAKGLLEVIKTYHLPFAQIWTPILNSSSTTNAKFKVIASSFGASSVNTKVLEEACNIFELIRWKGVVCKAFSSRNSCYCDDITQLRITEYPFAHIAKVLGLKSSIAICLKGCFYNYNHVIEFFLSANGIPHTWFYSLVVSIKVHLKSFQLNPRQQLDMIGNREGIGSSVEEKFDLSPIWHPQTKEISVGQQQDGKMLVENISNEQFRAEPEDSNCPDSLALSECFLLPPEENIFDEQDIWGTLFSPYLASSFDSTDVFSVQSFGGTSNGSSVVGEENVSQDFLIDSEVPSYVQPGKEGMRMFGLEPDVRNSKSCVDLKDTSDVQPSKEGLQEKSKPKEINRQVLEQLFGLTRADAARALGVTVTTLKRLCRRFGIERWPYQKRKHATSSSSQSHNEKQTSNYGKEGIHPNQSSTVGRSATTSAQFFLQAAIADNRGMMNMKVEYGKKIIRLQLSPSSEMKDLHDEIAMRFKLEVGKFDINYLDEDDEWILLTCDADLQIMKSLGMTKIRLSITNS